MQLVQQARPLLLEGVALLRNGLVFALANIQTDEDLNTSWFLITSHISFSRENRRQRVLTRSTGPPASRGWRRSHVIPDGSAAICTGDAASTGLTESLRFPRPWY